MLRTYLRILLYLRPYSRRLVLALIVTALFACLSSLSLAMIIPFTNVLFTRGEAPTAEEILPQGGVSEEPGLLPSAVSDVRERVGRRLLGWFHRPSPVESLERVCLVMFVLFFLKSLFAYCQSFLSVWLEQIVIRDIRNDLFAHIHRLSLGYFHSRRAGQVISRVVHDVTVLRMGVNAFFTVLVRDLFLLLAFLVIVLWVSWKLALLTFVVLPPIMILVSKLARRLRRHSTASQERMAEIVSVIQETVTGIRIVKAFAMERFETEKFRQRTHGFFRSLVRLQRVGALASPLSELMAVSGALLILWYGGRQVLNRPVAGGTGLEPGWFLLFLVAMLSMIRPVKSLTQVNTALQEAVAAGRRVFRVLDREPSITDSPGAREISEVKQEIAYQGVSFAYDGGPLVLRDIDLRASFGQVIAIVGPSGAGKSTLVDLLPRFHDPVSGRIIVDGVDIRDIRLSSLRGVMGMVSQETVLFNDTVANNIAYGAADVAPEQIEAAARAANAHQFIVEFPDGYHTQVGDRGVKLSGGQRQRIAIARAVLKNPAILILDEATSALDSESERLVQEAIDRLLANRTTFVIAHRLSTIQNADEIIVLDEGRIVQRGSHEELSSAQGLYRRLYEMQLLRTEGPGDPLNGKVERARPRSE